VQLRVHKRFQSAALARRCLRLSLAPLCPTLPEIEHAEAQQGTRPAQAQRRLAEASKAFIAILDASGRTFGTLVAYLKGTRKPPINVLNLDSCYLPATTAMHAVFPLSSTLCLMRRARVDGRRLRHSQTTKASCARVPLVCSGRAHVSLVPFSLAPARGAALFLNDCSARAAGVHCIGFSPAAQAKGRNNELSK
jgi:hypothetical protein